MSKVAIIMSTFNGREFIKEQLTSILNQSYTNFTLFIRDDGSDDSTLSILQSYATTDSRIKLIIDNPGKLNNNVGFGKSFTKAMQYALKHGQYDYFAFCDQDDYWENSKIEAAVNALNNSDSNIPGLYASNYYICNEKLNVLDTFSQSSPMKGVTFENMFFEGVFPGFTLVINRSLAEMAFSHTNADDIYYHDKWVTLIALGCDGKIIYDHTPLAKYRRHDSAASSTNLGALTKLKWRINKVLNGDFCPRTKQMLISYKDLFYKKVNYDIKDFLDIFTGNSTIKKLFFGKRLRRSLSGEILLRIIILIHKI